MSGMTFHQVKGRGVDLNGINCRPAVEPLAPTSGISGASLPIGGSFLNHDPMPVGVSVVARVTMSRPLKSYAQPSING